MAFLGGLALLGSAGAAYDKIRHEQTMEDLRQQTLQWHQQRQDQLLQLAQQRQQASQMMPGALASIFGNDGSGAPEATADGGNGNGGQYPPAPQPPAGAPPAGASGPAQLGALPPQQPAAGPPPGLPPPQQGGIPTFAQRFGGPGQQLQGSTTFADRAQAPQLSPPGQGDQMQPKPVQTQSFRPGKLYDVASPEEQAQLAQPQERGTQVAGDLPKNDAELFQRIQKTRPDLVNNPAFPQLFRALQKELKARQQQEHQQRQEQRQQRHEQRMEEESQYRKEQAAEKKQETKEQIESTVKGLKEGTLSPDDVKGLYGKRLQFDAAVAKEGLNLKQLEADWARQKRIIMAGTQQRMMQFRGYAETAKGEIDRVLELSDKLKNSGFSDWNRLRLEVEARTLGNSPEGQLIRSYLTAISYLKDNLATLASGAYAPTESAWKQARAQIDENWAVGSMHAALEESQRFINIRLSVMEKMGLVPGTHWQEERQKQDQQQQPGGGPKAGDVEDGYRFKGGNPGDPNSWEKAQ